VAVMLVVTAVVLAGFLRFVVSIIRRSNVLVDSSFSRTNP
jgi:hypothetical protein